MTITPYEQKSLVGMMTQSQWQAEYHYKIGWHNHTRSAQAPEALVISVNSVKGLQHLMRTIYELNEGKIKSHRITVRAAAGGRTQPDHLIHSESYSFSPLVEADIILQLTGKEFTKVKQVSYEPKRVRAGASLQVGELDKILYENMQLTTPTSSLIPYVTVAGLTATGGHGTGRDQPSFSGLIHAMRLCLPNGEIVTLDKSHVDFETIRGANLGLFGIVIDVELECISAKKMQCVREVCSIPDFLDRVSGGLFRHGKYVSVMYMPTYKNDELTNRKAKNVLVMHFRPVALDTADVNNHPKWTHFTQELSIGLEAELAVADTLRADPAIIPKYMQYLVTKSQIGETDSITVGSWPDIMHYQTDFPTDLDEFCALIPVSDHQPTAKNQDHPEIRETFTHLVNTLQEHASKGEYPLTYAVYMRFLSGTNGGLSITQHEPNHHVCAIDMTTNKNIPGWSSFKKHMADYAINERDAKCHWGKNIFPSIDYSAMYGDSFNQFTTALKNWYKSYNLDLSGSPLIIASLNHALRLPCALNEPENKVAHAPKVLSEKEQRRKAAAVIKNVDTSTPEGLSLHGHLSRTLDHASSSSSGTVPFFAISLSASQEKIERKALAKTNTHRRCTIL